MPGIDESMAMHSLDVDLKPSNEAKKFCSEKTETVNDEVEKLLKTEATRCMVTFYRKIHNHGKIRGRPHPDKPGRLYHPARHNHPASHYLCL